MTRALRSPTTIAELLVARAALERADGADFRFVLDTGHEDVSAAEVLARAQRVGARLRDAGVKPGDRVMLMLASQRDVVDAFFGATWAGAVPVPLFPPVFAQKLPDFLARFLAIAKSARASALLASQEIAEPALALAHSLIEAGAPPLAVLGPEAWHPQSSDAPLLNAPSTTASDLAFLQYTSGSTGMPKGVALTQQNVMHNVRAICAATCFDAHDVGVSWLPLYHDMGLVGGLLSTLHAGARLVSLSPMLFARRPIEWLRALSRERGTLSPAPNFAYQRCLQIPDAELAGLDLSSWRVAFNGAEPVDARTLDRFIARFTPHGFRAEAMYPVYGLAEHTLAVTFPTLGTPPHVAHIGRDALAHEHHAVDVPAEDPRALAFVSVGVPLAGVQVEIRREGARVADDVIGEICVKSESVMSGYFEDAEASAAVLTAGWLRTGDLGFLRGGELFITGREKDRVIVAGKKYVPQDLEAAAMEVPGVRAGRAVAFAVPSEEGERAVVVAERSADATADVATRVAQAVAARTGLTPRVVMVAHGALPLTSSGKVRRHETRRLLLEDGLDVAP
jgi:fatty-acyl-CoA synthase